MTAFTDDFNRANGALGANWALLTGSALTVVSNEAASPDSGTNHMRTVTATGSADMYAQATMKTSGASLGVGARFPTSGSTETGYVWRYNGTNCQLFVTSSGSFTSIGSAYTATLSANDVLRIEVEGTAIRGYVNGTLRASTTNSTVTTGQCGSLRIGGTAARMDDFSTDTLATNYNATGTATSAGSVASTAVKGLVAAVTLASTATVTATAIVGAETTAIVSSPGQVTATAAVDGYGTADIASGGLVTGTAVVARSTTASVTSTGGVSSTAALLLNYDVTASVSSAVQVTATPHVLDPNSIRDVDVVSVAEYPRAVSVTEYPRSVTITEGSQ